MSERAAKALADMDRAIGILERLTAPEPADIRRVEDPRAQRTPVVTLAKIER